MSIADSNSISIYNNLLGDGYPYTPSNKSPSYDDLDQKIKTTIDEVEAKIKAAEVKIQYYTDLHSSTDPIACERKMRPIREEIDSLKKEFTLLKIQYENLADTDDSLNNIMDVFNSIAKPGAT